MTIEVFFWNVVLVAGLVFVTFLRNVVRAICEGTANSATQPYMPQDLNP
jgi:hypothetical protein